MPRTWRNWALPVAVVVLLGVVAVGVATAPLRPADRTEAIASRLRCPVCQSESVADSPSTTARRMRQQIQQFVNAGRSEAWIRDYYAARYGRWILLDPPLTWDTLALWLLPVVVAAAGIAVVASRQRRDPPGELPEADRARLAAEIARHRRQEARR